jgi:TPP-dependent pyruvate/acetoin dehydrogenase alpha subunit
VADRAPGYGMPAEIVDGNDVWAVYEATRRAAAHCRQGLGPYLLECKTFRMTGHSAHDAGDYVPSYLWSEWAEKDPIQRLEKQMMARGDATRESFEILYAQVRREVDEAVAWAEASPLPEASTLTEGVYEEQR